MGNFREAQGGSGNKGKVRFPVLTNAHINGFSGAVVNNESGNIFNGIVDKYAGEEDRVYVTGRPSIKIFDDASDQPTAGSKGRGIHYWSANATRYFVNDGVIYKGDYLTPLTMTNSGALTGTAMTGGTNKVYFHEWESVYNKYLLIINCAAGEMVVIQATEIAGVGDDDPINIQDVITDIGTTGTGAPFHASETWDFAGLELVFVDNGLSAETQCCGAVVLDKFLFLGNRSGKIYNSNVDSFFTWQALGVVSVERENDKLLFIDKSKDHLVAFGERSTELFHDPGTISSPASPLVPRQDIFYNVGIISGQTGWRDGDDLYFVSMKPQGDFALSVMKNFQLQDHTTSTLDSYLRHSRTEATITPRVSGFSSGGHTYIILTLFSNDGSGAPTVPEISLVYDSYSGLWYEWETTVSSHSKFPIVNWTLRTPEVPVTAEGIMSNGDLFSVEDNFVPTDAKTSSAAYFGGDYEAESGANSYDEGGADPENQNITTKITFTNIELDSGDTKFLHHLKYIGNRPEGSQNITVEWSDDEWDTSYSSTIDLDNRTQINRLGSFNRRRFRISYIAAQQLRIEALEASYTQGTT